LNRGILVVMGQDDGIAFPLQFRNSRRKMCHRRTALP
jgi:hypothetical protein